MKILMLNYEFPPIGGGAANAHLHLLREYAKRTDLQVDVLTSAPQPGFIENKFSENITIYKVGIRKQHLHHWKRTEVIAWLIKSRSYYRKMIQNNKYDLVHAFFGFPTGWLCYRGSTNLPYIISLRGSDVPGQHARLKLDYKIMAPVFKAIWSKAAILVACSDGLKKRALDFMPSASITVIPNGVDLELFQPSVSTLESEPIRLLTVGRLSVTKRVEMLVEAIDILHKGGFNVRLLIVGGGPLESQLQRKVWDKGLGKIIRMAGRVDSGEMPKVYKSNDVFISASLQEGMSNAMLEAMACGLPIVTTDCEGVKELIADNGIVVQDAKAGDIAEAIKQLRKNKDMYRCMSHAARKRACDFDWDAVATDYVQLYQEILSG